MPWQFESNNFFVLAQLYKLIINVKKKNKRASSSKAPIWEKSRHIMRCKIWDLCGTSEQHYTMEKRSTHTFISGCSAIDISFTIDIMWSFLCFSILSEPAHQDGFLVLPRLKTHLLHELVQSRKTFESLVLAAAAAAAASRLQVVAWLLANTPAWKKCLAEEERRKILPPP